MAVCYHKVATYTRMLRMGKSESPTPAQQMVLLVGTCPIQARRLRTALQRYGCQVHTVTTGNTALIMARTMSPCAIVLDIDSLPDANGAYLCQMLRTEPTLIDIPIIILSHCRDTGTMQAAFQAGVNDYISNDTFVEHNLVESLHSLKLL